MVDFAAKSIRLCRGSYLKTGVQVMHCGRLRKQYRVARTTGFFARGMESLESCEGCALYAKDSARDTAHLPEASTMNFSAC